MAGRHFLQRRHRLDADIHGVLAARREAAARRRVEQARHRAGNGLQPLLVRGGAVDARDRADQALRVGMARIAEQLLDRRLLDHLAGIHHHHALRGLGDHAHGMGDQHDRHAEPLLHLGQQLEDLRLDGHVERGGRLVGDQQLGVAGQRHGDHHALAHAAGELVRIVVHRGAAGWGC